MESIGSITYTVTPPTLTNMPVDILFSIFKLLDRPSKLSLGLTCPIFLHLLASYYDLDRYRNDENIWGKIGLADGISWYDSAAQAAIIRWLAAPGCDDIDDPPHPKAKDDASDEEESDGEDSGAPEEDKVQETLSEWLHEKLNINRRCIFCASCYRYMLVVRPNWKINTWVKNMVSRPTWFRYCGPCEDSYGISRSRGAVLG